jgi:hypothetical protein
MAEQKTTTTLPAWYEDAAKELIALGKKRSQLGYVPWMGPDVAALDPASLAGMQGFDAMSQAFGMPAGAAAGAQQYLPQAQEYAGGVKGYSGFPAFEEAQKALKAKYPGIYEYLQSFSIPTGEAGTGTPPPSGGGSGTPPPSGGGGGGGSGSQYPFGGEDWWSLGGSGIGWQSEGQPIGPIFTRPGSGSGNNTLGGKGMSL